MEAFKQYLEDLIITNGRCVLRFRSDNEALTTVEGHITDLYAEEGEEYIMTDLGFRIPLQNLREVNGMPAWDLC
jgi:hypothetical protein